MAKKNFSIKKRRGVSQIIGTLVVLALVASIGSVILFQGLGQINAFNHDLTFHDKAHNDALREDILFEHVSFDPATNVMTLYIANIGTIDSTVSSVKVVKIDSQDLVISDEDLNEIILLESHIQFNTTASLTQGNGTWSDVEYDDKDYKISVATSKGNFFSTIARPPNT